eukprot:TRINITY_DN1159_c0_g1_i1.p1 TRINITY_DN1159_c0_g1~~TRINITY_DN1159_c0_g1_i1.p1  ORF type:complete len:530 (-),score=267.42 TRINITY_DN1159_c0_g1_i1:173-1540(-)
MIERAGEGEGETSDLSLLGEEEEESAHAAEELPEEFRGMHMDMLDKPATFEGRLKEMREMLEDEGVEVEEEQLREMVTDEFAAVDQEEDETLEEFVGKTGVSMDALRQLAQHTSAKWDEVEAAAHKRGLEEGSLPFARHMVTQLIDPKDGAQLLQLLGLEADEQVWQLESEASQLGELDTDEADRFISAWHQLQGVHEEQLSRHDNDFWGGPKQRPKWFNPTSLTDEHISVAEWTGQSGAGGQAPDDSDQEQEAAAQGEEHAEGGMAPAAEMESLFRRVCTAQVQAFTKLQGERDALFVADRAKKKEKYAKLHEINAKYGKARRDARRKAKGQHGAAWKRKCRRIPCGELPTAEVLLRSIGVEDVATHPHGKIMETAAQGIAYNSTWKVSEAQEFLARALVDLESYTEESVYMDPAVREAWVRGEDGGERVVEDVDEFDQYDNIDRAEEMARARV